MAPNAAVTVKGEGGKAVRCNSGEGVQRSSAQSAYSAKTSFAQTQCVAGV